MPCQGVRQLPQTRAHLSHNRRNTARNRFDIEDIDCKTTFHPQLGNSPPANTTEWDLSRSTLKRPEREVKMKNTARVESFLPRFLHTGNFSAAVDQEVLQMCNVNESFWLKFSGTRNIPERWYKGRSDGRHLERRARAAGRYWPRCLKIFREWSRFTKKTKARKDNAKTRRGYTMI